MPIDRLQGSDAGELDRATGLGRISQKFSRRQDLRHVAFGLGDELGKMSNGILQCRQLSAILQYDRLGKTLIPGHNATPLTERGFKLSPSRFVPVAVLTEPVGLQGRSGHLIMLVALSALAAAMPPMSTKSRQTIYGGRIIGAKIRAEGARETVRRFLNPRLNVLEST